MHNEFISLFTFWSIYYFISQDTDFLKFIMMKSSNIYSFYLHDINIVCLCLQTIIPCHIPSAILPFWAVIKWFMLYCCECSPYSITENDLKHEWFMVNWNIKHSFLLQSQYLASQWKYRFQENEPCFFLLINNESRRRIK